MSPSVGERWSDSESTSSGASEVGFRFLCNFERDVLGEDLGEDFWDLFANVGCWG